MVLAAFTKRAQIPFSAWLPAAIAAPTPVSALVHSSTLVTAGVFLLIRFSGLMLNYKLILDICFIVGVLTMFIAGLVANFEVDLKKVVALSTLSQLGLIFIILGVGSPVLAYFHLVIHALFKSRLFICAGFLIHNLQGSQDRRYGSVFNYSSPVLGVVFGCTNLALCGFPFMAGFYSKDRVLEGVFIGPFNSLIILIVVLSTGFTVSYSLRVVYRSVNQKGKMHAVSLSEDFRFHLVLRILVLFVISILAGFFFSWWMTSPGNVFTLSLLEKRYIGLVCRFSFLVIIGWFIFSNLKIYRAYIFRFFNLIFFLPIFRSFFSSSFFLGFGLSGLKNVDKGWLEYLGPMGLRVYLRGLGRYSQFSQLIISVNRYIISLVGVGVVLYIFYYLKSFYSVVLKPRRSNYLL